MEIVYRKFTIPAVADAFLHVSPDGVQHRIVSVEGWPDVPEVEPRLTLERWVIERRKAEREGR